MLSYKYTACQGFLIGRATTRLTDRLITPDWASVASGSRSHVSPPPHTSDQPSTLRRCKDQIDLPCARVWIGVHFGSRGLGHKIATWFLKKAGAKDGMDVDPCVIDVNGDLGDQYIKCMHLGGEYAYAGRDWVCQKVAKILGATILEEVHNHHNFAWRENHSGEDYWVVRKGATPAFPGQKGFVDSCRCGDGWSQ
jgi:hypothetical protein